MATFKSVIECPGSKGATQGDEPAKGCPRKGPANGRESGTSRGIQGGAGGTHGSATASPQGPRAIKTPETHLPPALELYGKGTKLQHGGAWTAILEGSPESEGEVETETGASAAQQTALRPGETLSREPRTIPDGGPGALGLQSAVTVLLGSLVTGHSSRIRPSSAPRVSE